MKNQVVQRNTRKGRSYFSGTRVGVEEDTGTRIIPLLCRFNTHIQQELITAVTIGPRDLTK